MSASVKVGRSEVDQIDGVLGGMRAGKKKQESTVTRRRSLVEMSPKELFTAGINDEGVIKGPAVKRCATYILLVTFRRG